MYQYVILISYISRFFVLLSETPSVNKLNLSLKSRFSVDYVLQEFQHIVSRVCQTMSTKVYKMLPKEEVDEDTNIGVLYVPNRSPFEVGKFLSLE